jgi:hypothetical protein
MLKNRNFVVSSFSIDRRAQESNMNHGLDETRAGGEETALAMSHAIHGRVVRDKKTNAPSFSTCGYNTSKCSSIRFTLLVT